jgi:hypothetical protein
MFHERVQLLDVVEIAGSRAVLIDWDGCASRVVMEVANNRLCRASQENSAQDERYVFCHVQFPLATKADESLSPLIVPGFTGRPERDQYVDALGARAGRLIERAVIEPRPLGVTR